MNLDAPVSEYSQQFDRGFVRAHHAHLDEQALSLPHRYTRHRANEL